MTAALRAEFRKLLSVRSTYVISLIFLLLCVFFAFYVHGYKDSSAVNLMGQSPMERAAASLFVEGAITQIASVLAVAAALIALLLLAHEYRYNTIVYTLTATNRRSKVLAAKIIAVLSYVLVYAVVGTAIALAMVWAGAAAAGHPLPHQDLNYPVFFAKIVFYCEAYALAGLLFITLIRNQVGAIAALLILPNTVEGLLTLLLKHNAVYLPFTALSQVVQSPTIKGAVAVHPARDALSGSLPPATGAWVFGVYLVFFWIIAWVLFLKRDAN